MDSPVHGNWSKDGRAVIVGNKLGTISLYTHRDEEIKYTATRVQQFFEYDVERHTDNPFEQLTEKPVLCAYNLAPYEIQPQYLIRFTELDKDITPDIFQSRLTFAKELTAIEERYYNDKLEEAL